MDPAHMGGLRVVRRRRAGISVKGYMYLSVQDGNPVILLCSRQGLSSVLWTNQC